jgi:mono/diheme cytochrome c family protein
VGIAAVPLQRIIPRVARFLATLVLTAALASPAAAAEPVTLERQNTFVKTHCAVCHTDRANNGGLSLEGFDAGVAAPSLSAMMLSKITSGTALATVHAAGRDAAAAATLERGLGKGAVNASGLGAPDKATVDGLVAAFASQSTNAAKWSVEQRPQRGTGGVLVTVSIMRELPSSAAAGRPGDIEAAMYRLVLTCNADARQGAMQLAWSPLPKEGRLAVAVDGKPATMHAVEGKERMGNGTSVITGPAALVFARFGAGDSRIELPKRTLTVSELFAGETVTFPFDELNNATRNALSACFR